MRQSPRAHYVGHNSTTRVPRSFVYLDTEAHRTAHGKREVQSFRLAVAAYDTTYQHKKGNRPREWHDSVDTGDLWEWITGRCRAKSRTVLVAHNLAYDLRISDAFTRLPALGWSFKAGRVDDGQAWMIFRNGDRTLACVDSLSWVPVSLAKLGELVGIGKLDPPDEEDTEDAWFARCRRDVEILAEVWTRLMAWIETDDLGNWKLSGAGQSWAAFRHRFMAHRMLVHEDDDARNAERDAAHTGRCEAWSHGHMVHGPYTEWDFTTAYAVIGAECAVPIKLAGEMHAPTLERVLVAAERRAVLCEVEVTTDVPILAQRTDKGIRWPVGTFTTTCWENELGAALAVGARCRVARAWAYRRAPALRGFCEWVLDGLDGTRGEVDPVVRVALKHWSRALIGRTAARWSKWEPWGQAPTTAVHLGRVHDASAGEVYSMLQLGTQLIRQTGAPDNPDAMVAVMSWVMAESRRRLWNAMQVAGIPNVLYVDTDSLIVNSCGSSALSSASIRGLRVKGEWSSIEILGPRQIIPGASLRAAGVPRGAVKVADGVYEAPVWSGLSRSLTSGQSNTVEVATRTFRLRGVDNRRRHLADHATAPFVADGREVVGSATA